MDSCRLSGGNRAQIPLGGCSLGIWSGKRYHFLRRRCLESAPGIKRYHFLRGTGYQPPAEQENAPNPARKVPRRYLGQKKASFPARNGIPTACRAEKCPKSCADGAPRRSRQKKASFLDAEPQKTKITIWFVGIADIFYFCARKTRNGGRG